MSDIPEPAHDKMWREIRAHLKVTDFAKVSWEAIYKAKQKLDYELTEWEWEYLRRKSAPTAPIGPPMSKTERDWWNK